MPGKPLQILEAVEAVNASQKAFLKKSIGDSPTLQASISVLGPVVQAADR